MGEINVSLKIQENKRIDGENLEFKINVENNLNIITM